MAQASAAAVATARWLPFQIFENIMQEGLNEYQGII